MIEHQDDCYYVIEINMSKDPNNPDWIRPHHSRINGTNRFLNHPNRRYRKYGREYVDDIAFNDPNVAAYAWSVFQALPQHFPLRMIRYQETVTKIVLFSC